MQFRSLMPIGLFLAAALGPLVPGVRAATTTVASWSGPIDSGGYLVGTVGSLLGDDDGAAQGYGRALMADPGNSALSRGAFMHAALAGSPLMVRLAAQQPPGVSAYVMGNDAAVHGRWDEARRNFNQIEADGVGRLLKPILLAWVDAAQGKRDAAYGDLSTNPSQYAFFFLVHSGLIADFFGQDDKAAESFRAASTLAHGSDLLLTRAYGGWLTRHGQSAQARVLVRSLVGGSPGLDLVGGSLEHSLGEKVVRTPLDGMASAYVVAASLARQEVAQVPDGNEGALKRLNDVDQLMLRLALQIDPAMPVARLMLAELLLSRDQAETARQVLGSPDGRGPLDALLSYRLAMVDAASGHLVEAEHTLRQLLAVQPDERQLLRLLASVLFDLKRNREALAVYDRVIAAASPLSAQDWPLLFSRAAAYDQSGNWPKAEADLKAAMKLAPNEPLLMNYLGYAWTERGIHLDEAAGLLRRALAIAPDNAAIRDSLGWVMFRHGELQTALSLLQRAAEQTPLDPAVNYHLGEAYWQSGRKVEAADQWNRALHQNPDPSDLAAIRKALARVSQAGAMSATIDR